MMKDTLVRLRAITQGCREDMHEPDTQGLSAHVTGQLLDNSFGGYRFVLAQYPEAEELVVTLCRGDALSEVREEFSLATLVALARKAVI